MTVRHADMDSPVEFLAHAFLRLDVIRQPYSKYKIQRARLLAAAS